MAGFSRTGPTPQEVGVANENFRIIIDDIFREFTQDENVVFYEFPAHFNNVMRKYIHTKCHKMGLKSKSHGKEPNRTLTIFKKKSIANLECFDVELTPMAAKMLAEINTKAGSPTSISNKRQKIYQVNGELFGRLFVANVQHVNRPHPNPLMEFRKTLPIFEQKDVIMQAIRENSVVIVSAETGSGKTTQIPQYILDEACERNTCVSVICTQPRRLSTIAVADRVSSERGENVGLTVGYQIKLESKLGPNTSLIYCTNGVLLRTLMAGDECFRHITHVIVDEIHERDKFTDFLLICLRECLKRYSHLRVILMSATMDMDVFSSYFSNVKVVNVKGRNHPITSWFLDDILLEINYENDAMRQMRLLREKNGSMVRKDQIIITPRDRGNMNLDPEIAEELNETILSCFHKGTEDNFTHLMQLILNENVSPNYQEPNTLLSPLMTAAVHGILPIVEQLLNLGADPFVTCQEGTTASGWAQRSNRNDVVSLLSMYQVSDVSNNQQPPQQICQALADYDRTVRDDTIDYDLIVSVIKYIHLNMERTGAILVFIPGYDDIMQCNERIANCGIDRDNYRIFMLHGSMQINSQNEVFTRMPHGKQKIVLSTNLAETSLTIDDVRYVVDSGRVKQKTYDAISGVSMLRTQWISMASAMQRAGRAGRTQNGYCFHLYSMNRYNSFSINTTPEILRVPLHELCLQTKRLAPTGMAIENFLKLAIEPPGTIAIKNSINVLKHLGALDQDENLTLLGHHLLQLSIEPHLGKILIYGSILKCLDPILTIVSTLAHKDPFILPTNAGLKQAALNKRRQLSDESLSDHMVLLRAFQQWQSAKVSNHAYYFCDEYFMSPATMEMIVLTRSQLMSQLRALGFVLSNPKDNIADLNTFSDDWALVKACIAAGLYPNVAYYNEKKLHTRTEKNVNINLQSSLKNLEYYFTSAHNLTRKCWLVYEELSKNNLKASLKSATAVTPLTIGLLCGLKAEAEFESVIIDDWYELNFHNSDVIRLRCLIETLIDKKIDNPRYKLDQSEKNILALTSRILCIEDEAHELKKPDGIGVRPKILHYRPPVDRHYYQAGSSRHQNNQYGNYYNHRNRRNKNTGNNSWHTNHEYNNQQNYPFQDPTAGVLYELNRYPELFPPTALYFIIKPMERKNVVIGMHKCCWKFSPQTEKKLFQLFMRRFMIILIFNVNGTQFFHGVARLLDTNRGAPAQPCPLEWITQNEVPMNVVKRFLLPKVHAVSDGQQLTSVVGQQLCTTMLEFTGNDSHRPITMGNNRKSR